jgi:hypothetical protein
LSLRRDTGTSFWLDCGRKAKIDFAGKHLSLFGEGKRNELVHEARERIFGAMIYSLARHTFSLIMYFGVLNALEALATVLPASSEQARSSCPSEGTQVLGCSEIVEGKPR